MKCNRTVAFLVVLSLLLSLKATSAFAAGGTMPDLDGKQAILDAPVNLTAELKVYQGELHYFELRWTNTENALKIYSAILNNPNWESGSLWCQVDTKTGNGKWDSETQGDLLSYRGFGEGPTGTAESNPIDHGEGATVDIKNNYYALRIRYMYWYTDDAGIDRYVYGPFSNVFEIGVKAFKGASAWAVPELERAAKYGLITDKVKDQMNAPITREEFAEVAVKLCDRYIGKPSTFSDPTVFSDTDNPEIFKAFDLKIVNGTNSEKKLFSPKDLTNREQVATMLYRAVQAIEPESDFSTEGYLKFSDEGLISAWALDSVRFMSKYDLIRGSEGKFDPKGTCTREMAVIIAMRVYEKFSGITVQ